MDVGVWLRSLGLGQYEALFRASEIDADILPELTDADLEKLGVPLGHRKRLLRAISGLAAAETSAAASAPTGSKPHDAAERRQLTVMFCDLVGSTALASRLDPEDLREVLGAYHAAIADGVAGLEGYVAKYMGDGVSIYFGYPQAHEDDAERAVRAGLALVERVGRLESGSGALASRIGIATGLVVVGDLIGAGETGSGTQTVRRNKRPLPKPNRAAVQRAREEEATAPAQRAAELARLEVQREAARTQAIAAAKVAAEMSPDNVCRDPKYAGLLHESFNYPWTGPTGAKRWTSSTL